jgi:tetratricopeptide (TPR) repeat protein
MASAIIMSVSAQTADRTSAIMAYKDYIKAVQEPNFDKAKKKILEAKEYIDKAYAAGDLKNDPKTLFYRGEIYMALPTAYIDMASMSKVKDPCSAEPVFNGIDKAALEEYGNVAVTSYKESIQKANKKDDFTNEIKFKMNMTRITAINCGNQNYNNKNYEKAIENYSSAIGAMEAMNLTDSMAHYNRGLCYERLQKYNEAMQDFVKCASLSYGGADIYRLIFESAAASGKVEEGGKYLKEGRAKYPKDQSLVFSEVNYYLGLGKNEEAEKAINEALALDPKNPTLYFALGNTYDNLANPRDKEGKEMEKPKNFSELSKKGEDAYKKAIEIKPDYFDALYNLGVLKYNEGAEYMNRIKDIADNAEYDREKAKADEKFTAAMPYLEKARTVNPKDRDNLRMLKVIYVRTGNAEKAAEVQKELDNK